MFTTISESVSAYDDMLDEMHDIELAGIYGVRGSEVLNQFDPIAYKCGWIDYMDSLGIDTDELEDDYTFDRDRM